MPEGKAFGQRTKIRAIAKILFYSATPKSKSWIIHLNFRSTRKSKAFNYSSKIWLHSGGNCQPMWSWIYALTECVLHFFHDKNAESLPLLGTITGNRLINRFWWLPLRKNLRLASARAGSHSNYSSIKSFKDWIYCFCSVFESKTSKPVWDRSHRRVGSGIQLRTTNRWNWADPGVIIPARKVGSLRGYSQSKGSIVWNNFPTLKNLQSFGWSNKGNGSNEIIFIPHGVFDRFCQAKISYGQRQESDWFTGDRNRYIATLELSRMGPIAWWAWFGSGNDGNFSENLI